MYVTDNLLNHSIPIKTYISGEQCKRYYRDPLGSDDIELLRCALEELRRNGKGDPIKSGMAIGYVMINGRKRPDVEVIYVGSPESLIDRMLDIYNLYDLGVGCSLYTQNIIHTAVAEIRDGTFRLVR